MVAADTSPTSLGWVNRQTVNIQESECSEICTNELWTREFDQTDLDGSSNRIQCCSLQSVRLSDLLLVYL
jgi:hypothetical protein